MAGDLSGTTRCRAPASLELSETVAPGDRRHDRQAGHGISASHRQLARSDSIVLLKEAGFLWSASLNGDDVPYMHPSSLVEIPVHLELEDRPYFQFNFTPAFPKGQSRIASYDSVLSNWIAEFDAYRKFGACFVLQLRPEMTGTPGRIFLVEELIKHIQSFDDVWIATAAEISAWHLANNAHAPSPDHPLNVFDAYQREHRVLR